MFARATEPFYNWAPIEPFDRLGAEFVSAMTRKVSQLSRYPLSEREALRAFEALKRTPEFFRRYLQCYLSYAELGSRAALDDTLAHVFNNSGYSTAWNRLLPADQAILRALARGITDLHSLPARKQLGEELGLGKAASLDAPKSALRRLQTRTGHPHEAEVLARCVESAQGSHSHCRHRGSIGTRLCCALVENFGVHHPIKTVSQHAGAPQRPA